MIGQMAIAIAFPGFNDLGRTVTPVFPLMDQNLRSLQEDYMVLPGIIYATDLLLQNKTKIVCLR